jgi:CheY-like chemotaxis protein
MALADASPAPRASALLEGKRVLLVDDNATNRTILLRLAESWKMLPTAVAGGREALEALGGGEPFDLAILDMTMPEMDGVALATAIARREERPPQMVLLSSAAAARAAAACDAPLAAVLRKPIKPAALLAALERAASAAAPAPRNAGATASPRRLGDRHPLRVLVAEDNLVNQRVATLLLAKLGYDAVVVGTGLQALEALRQERFDVVFMDVHMPEMDGLEATRRIGTDLVAERRPYVVAMTASAMVGDREACFEAGMDDYVSKPVRPQELEAALERAVAQLSVLRDGQTLGAIGVPGVE